MKTTIRHRELFNCAHQVEDDPLCGARIHGHDWYAEAVVAGTPDLRTGRITTDAPGWLVASVSELDYKFANEMLPGVYPTCEGIAAFLFERLRLECPGLLSVTVGFTDHSATVEA